MLRAEPVIPVPDAAALGRARRRTTVLRVALALVLLALLALTVLAARGLGAPAGSVVPQGRSGVVVLDLSRSIGPEPAAAARKALGRLDSPDERVGLVVFSDAAYELLPPGSPGTELRPILRFFTPVPGRTDHGRPVLPVSPWDETFRAGTQISVGLAAGWAALRRAHLEDGALVLVSDLATEPEDQQKLVPLLIDLRRHHVPVKILALDPALPDRNLFVRLLGKGAFVSDAPSIGVGGVLHGVRSELSKPLPWTLVGLSLALLLALGLNELACGRLVVPSGRTA